MSVDVPSDHPYYQLTNEQLFCLAGCSTYSQYHLMRTGFVQGHCAFCHLDRTRNHVLWEDAHFMLWQVPDGIGKKRPLRFHILIVPKRHIRFVADLTDAEAISFVTANRFAREQLGYSGGLNHAREGDMRNNAGTVPHLHFNVFEPDGSAEVRVPVYKDPADRIANEVRAACFAELYRQGLSPERFDELVQSGVLAKDGTLASQL